MSILAATDFSPCSRTAVRLAAAQARRRRVPLILVHAIEPSAMGLADPPLGGTGWERDMLAAAEVAIAREASDVRQSGLTVETRVLLGSAASVITESAREHVADLIVVGTHGRKGAAHLFVGSVAEGVVRSSTCPVLVTREAFPDLDRWEGRTAMRLAVAADGSAATQAAFSWVKTFVSSQPCDLSLLRVYWPPEEALRYGLDDPWDGPRRDPELLPLLERDLRRDAQEFMGEVPTRLRFRTASREASEVIAEDASLLEADALVVGVSRHRSARWAALRAGAVLRHSTLPVICVPEAAAPVRRHIDQIRSVLVATDLSEASRAVIGPAYALLRAAGGRVELCTVHARGPVDGIAEIPVEPRLRDEERAAIEAQLRGLIPPEADASGIATVVAVIEGRFPAETILAAAERLDVDLIAVASHGRSGFKRALLGSVAEQIARQSPRPVIIVRSQADRTRT